MAVRDDAEPPETRRFSRDEPDVPLILSVVAISPFVVPDDGDVIVTTGGVTSILTNTLVCASVTPSLP